VKKTQQNKPVGCSRRLHFPEDEQRISWISRLLDAFAVVDTGVAMAFRNIEKKGNMRLACSKGCDVVCCRQKDIPLHPHELVGLHWFVSEKMSRVGRDIVTKQALLGILQRAMLEIN